MHVNVTVFRTQSLTRNLTVTWWIYYKNILIVYTPCHSRISWWRMMKRILGCCVLGCLVASWTPSRCHHRSHHIYHTNVLSFFCRPEKIYSNPLVSVNLVLYEVVVQLLQKMSELLELACVEICPEVVKYDSEACGTKLSWPILSHYHRIFMQGLRTTISMSKCSSPEDTLARNLEASLPLLLCQPA